MGKTSMQGGTELNIGSHWGRGHGTLGNAGGESRRTTRSLKWFTRRLNPRDAERVRELAVWGSIFVHVATRPDREVRSICRGVSGVCAWWLRDVNYVQLGVWTWLMRWMKCSGKSDSQKTWKQVKLPKGPTWLPQIFSRFVMCTRTPKFASCVPVTQMCIMYTRTPDVYHVYPNSRYGHRWSFSAQHQKVEWWQIEYWCPPKNFPTSILSVL